MGKTGAYVRASTKEQADDHQRDGITSWADEEGLEIDEWYVDIGSGAKDDREDFQRLRDDLAAGDLDYVVVWEISRISRRGATLQQFFDTAEENDTIVAITNGSVEEVRPDGTGRFVADIIGMVYQEERRTLIRRVESGIERAQREGKWIGQVPAGFVRDADGFLQPNLNPDHDDGEVGFLEIREALNRLHDGESYRSVASSLPISRPALMNIDKDEERREWYLSADAEDERVDKALDLVKHRT